MAYSDMNTSGAAPDNRGNKPKEKPGDKPVKKERGAGALDRCGMARAALLLGDKWTLLVVREALYGVTRFDAMQTDLGVPRTVLSDRLKRLVAAGVLTKRPYKEPGARLRHRYVLTPMGVDLALPLMALMQWGEKHLPAEGDAPTAEIVERNTGARLRVGLAGEDGKTVALGDAHFRING